MHNQKSPVKQAGIVSIVVTIILMIVLSLIVLSFAKISRREQRNALDRQLSTQAFYAAESGVNDARKVVQGWVTTGNPKLDSDYMSNCTEFASPAIANLTLPGVLAGSGAAEYTCLFVDPSPPSIVFTKSDEQHVFPVKGKGGAPINTMEIYWDNASGGNNFSGCPAPAGNPASLTNCDAPLLRVELVDANNLSASKVFFIYPSTSGGGTISYGSATGSTAQANCSSGGPNKCRIQITGLGSSAGYFMRVKGIYGPAALTITANSGSAELVGAQALIDATGKATDVERRIQVRIQANNLSNDGPLYGLEGTGKICKQFTINGTTANGGPCFSGNPN